MSQSNFMRNVRMTLPQFITNVTSYNDTVRILKNKGIITENIFNTPQMGGVTNSNGTAGYINNTSKMDKEYADSLKSREDKIIEQTVDNIFEDDVITDKSRVEFIIRDMRKEWLNSKQEGDVYDFIKAYMDSYIQGAEDYVSSVDGWDWNEKETNNSIYGLYAKSMVDQAIENTKENEANGELEEADIYNVAGNPEEEENAKNARIGKEDTMSDDEIVDILAKLDTEEDAKHTAPNIRALKEAKSKWENTSGKEMYAQFKEIDDLNGQEVFTGITCEMENNPLLSKKEATKIVIKKLRKQPYYYTDYKLSGVEGYEPGIIGNVDPKTREMKPVAKDNLVDKGMGMKPVKNVVKAKASANKAKKETNKAKDIDVLSLVAQTLRGVSKMQSQGEKSKTVKLRETIQKLVKEIINEGK